MGTADGAGPILILENEVLRVGFQRLPVPVSYLHKPTGTEFLGGALRRPAPSASPGCLVLNGRPAPEEQWAIEARREGAELAFRMRHRESGIGLAFRFRLEANALAFAIEDIAEGASPLSSLGWQHLPWLVCEGAGFSLYRDAYRKVPWDSPIARGLWWREDQLQGAAGAHPDEAPAGCVHACAFDGKVCCYLATNYPILPLTAQFLESDRFPGRSDRIALGLGEWRHRVRSRLAPPLTGSVVFLGDLNGDGAVDECDHHLAVNRSLPEPSPMYREAIWYKIFCASPGKVFTTWAEALEIIRHVDELSGGLPQIAYLVGWQYDGHDTGYPALDRLNPRLGSRQELLDLIGRARTEYGCTVSVHANVDDSYREHPQWDEAIIGRDVDGSPMRWEVFNGRQSYHISHAKDVERGSIFRRLDAMLDLLPLERTLHLDAFRGSNWSWERDGFIGDAEELFCGLVPILRHLASRGLDVSTEGLNGTRIEPAGLFSAFWHLQELHPQIYHGKVLGGGRGSEAHRRAVAAGIDTDLSGEMLRGSPERIADLVGLEAMLSRFLVGREMLEYRVHGRAVTVRYGGGVLARFDAEGLRIEQGETVLADDQTRFMPFGDRIYVYSTRRGSLERRLPDEWLHRKLHATALTGASGAMPWTLDVSAGRVTVTVEPHVPVIITRSS
jgi:hypothetical protein